MNGKLINSNIVDASGPATLADPAGGAYIAWADDRIGILSPHIYMQRLAADGTELWTAGGLKVSVLSGFQGNPVLAPAPGGGVYVAWWHRNYGSVPTSPIQILVQRLDLDGNRAAGWPEYGIEIAPSEALSKSGLALASDSDGLIVAWCNQNESSCEGAVYAARLTSNGAVAPGWPAEGIALTATTRCRSYPQLASDGTGGQFVVYEEAVPNEGRERLMVQRFLADGSLPWGGDGIAVDSAPVQQSVSTPVPDGVGGIYVPWTRNATAEQHQVRVQRITSYGDVQPGWPANGIIACGAYGQTYSRRAVSDGMGGCYLSIEGIANPPTSGQDQFLQRVTSSGAIASGWPADGLPVSTASGDQRDPVLLPLGAAGVLFLYEDMPYFTYANRNIVAQAITPSGTIAKDWPESGLMIADADGGQGLPAPVLTTQGNAIIAWSDTRDGEFNTGIYAQSIPMPDGTVSPPGMFSPPFSAFETAGRLGSEATGDFNHDGWPDLAVSSYYASQVSVLLGTGGANFATRVDYPVMSPPVAIETVDLNADGTPDLAILNVGDFNGSNAGVSVFLGNGDGSFQNRIDTPTHRQPNAFAFADLNGDGRQDLVIGSDPSFNAGGSYHLGNGDGSFGPAVDFQNDAGYWVLAFDTNHDGFDDVVTTRWDAPNHLEYYSTWLGGPSGLSSSSIDFGGAAPSSNRPFAVAGQFGFGSPTDIVTSNGGRVFRGNGDGSFAGVSNLGGLIADDMGTADFDGDGKADLVTVSGLAAQVVVYFGNDDCTFDSGIAFGTSAPFPSRVLARDLDVDGVPDLAVTSHQVSGVWIMRNRLGTGVPNCTAVPVIQGPDPDVVIRSDRSDPIAVTWSDPSPCIRKVDLFYSVASSMSTRIWRRMAQDVDASQRVWQGIPFDAVPLAETTDVRFRLVGKTSTGVVLGSSISSTACAVGHDGSIRLDVQSSNQSRFSPPVLFWNPVGGADHYTVRFESDGRSSCKQDSWESVPVTAPHRWQLVDGAFWKSAPAARYVQRVQAFAANGSPIGSAQVKSITRFKLSDLVPSATGTPVLLVHGWISDQGTWYDCTDRSPLVEAIAGAAPRMHPWAIEYPNLGRIKYAAAGLDSAVRFLCPRATDPPVRLVAHSMGGLVSRACLEGIARNPNSNALLPRLTPTQVSHLTTLATPHLGEPRSAVGWGQFFHRTLGTCGLDLDSDAGFDLQDDSDIIRDLNSAGVLPAIRYFFAAGTESKYEGGHLGGLRENAAHLKSGCTEDNDGAVDICSGRGDCQKSKHPYTMAAFDAGAFVTHRQYPFGHGRMSKPGSTAVDCDDPEDLDEYDSKHRTKTLEYLNDVVLFLRSSDVGDIECPSGSRTPVTYRLWCRADGVNTIATRAHTSPHQSAHASNADELPVAGAQITLRAMEDGASAVSWIGNTEADGSMQAELGAGTYTVTIAASGFAPRTELLVIDSTGIQVSHSMDLTVNPAYVGPRNPRLTFSGTSAVDSVITLVPECESATEVLVGDSLSFGGATWQPMTPTISHTLRGGVGFHTVWAKFRDAQGRESDVVSRMIELVPAIATGIQVNATGGSGVIWIDGSSTGQMAPALISPVGPGIHRISVIAEGLRAEPSMQALDVDSGSTAIASFTMTPSAPPTATTWQSPVADGFAGPANPLRWRRATDIDPGPIFYSLVLSSPGSPGSTIWSLTGICDTTVSVPAILADSTEYTANLIAIDSQGTAQADPATTRHFFVDRTPPVGFVTFPAAGTVVPGTNPDPLTFEVTDWSGPATAVVRLSTDGGATYPHIIASGTYSQSIEWTPPAVRSSNCRIRLDVTDRAGNVGAIESALFTLQGDPTGIGTHAVPERFAIRSSPTVARTISHLTFDMPVGADIRVEVFDVAGRSLRLLASGTYEAGSHPVDWDLRDSSGQRLGTGVYFVRLRAPGANPNSRVVIVQ